MNILPGCILLFALSVLAGAAPAQPVGWQRLAPLPEPNGGFIAGTVGDDLVVLGGTNWRNDAKHWLDKIWIYRNAEQTWRPAGILSSAIAYAAAGQNHDGIWFVGGSDGQRTHQQLYRLDTGLKLQSVTQVAERFVYAGAAMAGNDLYVLGGATDAADLKNLSDRFFAIDLASGKLRRLPSYPGGKVTLPVLVTLGERIHVFSGATFDATRGQVANVATAYAYSIPHAQWSRIKSYPFAVRGLAGVALDDRHIFLGGGYKSEAEGFTNEAFLYDAQTDFYRKTTPLPYRAMAGLVKSGDRLYELGGEDEQRHRTSRVYWIAWKSLISQTSAKEGQNEQDQIGGARLPQ